MPAPVTYVTLPTLISAPAPASVPVFSLARNLADLAADALTRLADDLDAIAGLDLSAAPGHERGRAEATVSESRRMAAGALERLADALRGTGQTRHYALARTQAASLRNPERGDAVPVRWAAAWRAFADA